jgi:hypothetical protein
MRHRSQGGCVACFCGSGSFTRFCRSGSFLSGKVLFGEALLSRLAFPVVIPDPPSVDNQPAPKLPKHGPRRYNRNLPGAVRGRQNVLLDEIVLLRLVRNDLEERLVLVEQQVRVSVSQNFGAFGRQHEQPLSPVWHEEGPTSILPSTNWRSVRSHLGLSGLVILARYKLVTILG